MKRKVKITEGYVRPVHDNETEYTHEIEVTETQYLEGVNSSFFTIEGGFPRYKNEEELSKREEDIASSREKRRINTLEKLAQNRQLELYPLNFSFLIGTKTTPEALACKAEIDLIWEEYDECKKDSSREVNFSEVGKRAHTYDEVDKS